MAANQAIVDYNTEKLEQPILTVEEAVERSSFFEVPPVLQPKQVGDFSKGMAEADHKIFSAKVFLICFHISFYQCLETLNFRTRWGPKYECSHVQVSFKFLKLHPAFQLSI